MRILFTLLFLIIVHLPSCAQCPVDNKAFKAGESLVYDLYFNWKFVWVKCGNGYLTAREVTHQGKPALRMDLLSTSNKKCDAVFTMRDTLVSIATPQLVPLYFRKGAHEGSRYTVDEVWYTYPGGKSHVKQRYQDKDGKLSEHHHESDECNYDMLSILSKARSFDATNYKVGQRIKFPMATGKHVDMQTLVYKGKKNWKANDGKTYRCLVFSLLDYESQKDKELLRFYVTDDQNHLPVRIDFYLKFGTAKAFYKSGTGLRNPINSIVK